MIKAKRVYEPCEESDGHRVLIDRLWPRGLKKENSRIDSWLKELAPSTTLRKWFDHDPGKWREFKKRYHAELRANASKVIELRALEKQHSIITLLFAAKDEEFNNAVALKDYLKAAR